MNHVRQHYYHYGLNKITLVSHKRKICTNLFIIQNEKNFRFVNLLSSLCCHNKLSIQTPIEIA